MPPVEVTEPRADTEALAAAAAGGDRDALGQLYERYADDARRAAYIAVGGNQDLAAEVTGEAWVRVGKGIHTYQTRQSGGFVGWLIAIVRNVAADHYRKPSTRRETLTASMLLLDAEADASARPAEVAERREQARAVTAALRRLTRDQQECLLWRFWCNLSAAETAEIMGRTSGAVGVLQHRALAAMRRALPAGVSDAGDYPKPSTRRTDAAEASRKGRV